MANRFFSPPTMSQFVSTIIHKTEDIYRNFTYSKIFRDFLTIIYIHTLFNEFFLGKIHKNCVLFLYGKICTIYGKRAKMYEKKIVLCDHKKNAVSMKALMRLIKTDKKCKKKAIRREEKESITENSIHINFLFCLQTLTFFI